MIIPVAGNEQMTKNCLASIHAHSENFEIILIENGGFDSWTSVDLVIRNDKNLGFPIAINQGIAKARGEIIVLLNNDTVVSPGWLDRLSKHLETYDMVGPVTNSISGPQQVSISDIFLPEGILEASELIYKRNAGRIVPFYRLVFFCVAIKRSVIEKIGVLDEQFSPGNFEDDDFCLRAIEAGFKLGIAEDTFIYHAGSATHKSLNIDHAELIRTNLSKFNLKHPPEKRAELIEKLKTNCADIPAPAKRSLALVMIARNEEQGLERAIASARPFVDQVVVAVDRSSTDKTAEIAERLADVVDYFDWQDDFAWARNFAHRNVKTDWLLFLDGHEYVKDYAGLEMMLSSPADALLCSVELESGSVIRNPRIYRNGLKFEGAIHEIQNAKTLSVYSNFLIVHGRPDGQAKDSIAFRKKQSDDMVPRIMTKQLQDDPTNTRALLHLALHAQSLGQFREAIKYQKRYFKYPTIKGERWFLYFNQALCHFSLGHYLRAFWACDNAEKETPRRWEIAKLRGLLWFSQGNYTKAIKFFVDSFDENTGDVTYKPYKRNDSEIWNLIGESYFRLGRPGLAGEAFEQASNIAPNEKNKKFYFDRASLMREIEKQG